MTSVFEVRDASDDERYYQLGIFSTLPRALEFCHSESDRISDYSWDDDIEELEIYELLLDHQPHTQRLAARIHRELEYQADDDDGNDKWKETVEMKHYDKPLGY